MQKQKSNKIFKPKTRWISKGIEELFAQVEPINFDVVIVGTGYGGSISASQLAGCLNKSGEEITICVLERGKEFLSGMFPSSVSELPKHVRFNTQNRKIPDGNLEGLFDIRINNDVSTILANGLGGGSLINAGVMEIPNEKIFEESQWPKEISFKQLLPYYKKSKQLLGASTRTDKKKFVDNTISEHIPLHEFPKKYKALKKLANSNNFRDAAITVALSDKQNFSSDYYREVELKKCKFCGDCATGCNHQAKKSLDTNLLYHAHKKSSRIENTNKKHLQIYTGATVLKLEKNDSTKNKNWCVNIVYTDKYMRSRQVKPLVINADKVILAAGSLGSTEILLRSRDEDTLNFSPCLGKNFSTNGDTISAGYNQNSIVNACASSEIKPSERYIGPTITGIIDSAYQNRMIQNQY